MRAKDAKGSSRARAARWPAAAGAVTVRRMAGLALATAGAGTLREADSTPSSRDSPRLVADPPHEDGTRRPRSAWLEPTIAHPPPPRAARGADTKDEMTRSPTKTALAALTIAALLPATGAAQQSPAPPPATDPDGYGPVAESCTADGYRAFDFWLGDWSVENTDGAVIGSNTISRISHGCAVLEHWVGGGGVPGQSLNHFDPAEGSWHQRWVGGNGQILEIAGGLEGESMVLSGEREGQDGGTIIDRVKWTPKPDGSVEQDWQISRDDGATWQQVFLGIYRRTEG
jgi:hypothetical protein